MNQSLRKKVLWVGIGCVRGTSKQLMETAIEQVFAENKLTDKAIAGIATIDIKASEVNLIELCREKNLPLKFYTGEILSRVCVPNPGKTTANKVGTPSVAEAAAILAAGGEQLRVKLLVSKQIFRSSIPNDLGAVTLAVAQALSENSPSPYEITLRK